MKLIAKNDEVISFLSNDESLMGNIDNITIQTKNNVLCIGLNINLMYSKKNKIVFLEFEVIKEYAFYYSFDRSFYNIERYIFFKSGKLFYISFDPASEQSLIRDENDNDFILAENVLLYSKE